MSDTIFVIRRDTWKLLRRSRRQVYDDIEAKVAELRKHPWILSQPNLRAACDYLAGYDSALFGLALDGLFYWLILKVDREREILHWSHNLPRLARRKAGKSASQAKILEEGCKLLGKFFAYRRRHGTRKLSGDFMKWRKRRMEGKRP
jgi:hypothetical protein